MQLHILKQLRPSPILEVVARKALQHNRLRGCRMMSLRAPPVFRKANEDGSEADVSEDELYQYTRYRWLSNEAENLATRYRKFNLDALLDVAVKAAGGGAKSCIKLLKCTEGQFNKAFLMTMDNGTEVLAKLPNPNAGPAFYTTASEVATRNFLREILTFPIPQILAYSSNSHNPVGAEYIIEKKAEGKPLGSLWVQWPKESKLSLVTQLVELEAKLASVSFQKIGCIYYKDDLATKGLLDQAFQPNISASEEFSNGIDALVTEKYVIGPLTEARLWEGSRAAMTLDRGPWSNAVEYLTAMATNEVKWTETYAKPQMNYFRSSDAPELPGEYVSLLQRYLLLVPYLASAIPESLQSKTIFHGDLHLDNIFVNPDTKKITNIIDWQSTLVTEIFFQHKTPLMLPLGNSYGHDRTPEPASKDSKLIEPSNESLDILSHYQTLTKVKNPLRWAAINNSHSSIITEPVSLLCGMWDRNDVFSFRHALITIIAHWNGLVPNSVSCPVRFSEHELELHESEMELLEDLRTVLYQLQDENLIPLGGRVLREDYERAQVINNRVKDMFINMAEDERQKALHSRLWPY